MDFRTLLLASATSLLATSCALDSAQNESDTDTDAPPERPFSVAPLQWSACNLFTGGPTAPAECAEAEVPLRWDSPAGRTISLFVKRLPAAGKRRGSIWLLDGGPGGGGVGPELIAGRIAQREQGLDIYIPHHRGTGESTKLRCPGDAEGSDKGIEITLDEWPACTQALTATWGEDLGAFSTTEAARDLGALIQTEKKPGDVVFAYGGSYGTYLANRYLKLFPTQASGIILDSICPAGDCKIDKYDTRFDEVTADLLARCGADPVCSSHAGEDPRARLAEVYASLDEGRCPGLVSAGIDRKQLRRLLATVFPALPAMQLWSVIPAVIARAARCAPADVVAIKRLFDRVTKPGAPPSAEAIATSLPLQKNVAYSELWSDPPPAQADLLAQADATVLSEATALHDARIFPLWPRYARDEHFGAWGDNDLPMLMLNGDLDAQTPLAIAQQAGDHFRGAHQTFVALPRSSHITLVSSPIDPSGATCGGELVFQFLADPKAQLDLSCKDKVLPIDFAGSPQIAQMLFGTEDMYENP